MKKFYAFLAVAAATIATPSAANAFTVDEIAGTYNATDMNFSQNQNCFMVAWDLLHVEAVSWDNMTITVVEGNKVKITNFIKKGINNGLPDKEGVFDIEGEFDPATNTITFNPTAYTYPAPSMSVITMNQTIAKYDGKLELRGVCEGDFESFKATFDENKNLTVEPWAMYETANKKSSCIPTYKKYGTEYFGTYFTFVSSTGIEDVVADENAPVEYYNLQGVKVENPESGMYIRRQGSKVEKVVIR